jgi:mxaJ protein
VTRKDRELRIRSLDDTRLKHLRVGIQITGDDYSNPPAEQALAKRGIIRNVVGYSVYGDYSEPNPPARLIEAVAKRDVDVAIAWGPLAGYFAQKQSVPLELTPVSPAIDLPFTPFVFDISMGVRTGNDSLRFRLDDVIRRRGPEIRRILERYGVPLLDGGRPATSAALLPHGK